MSVPMIRMKEATIILAQGSQEQCDADVKSNSHLSTTPRAFALC